MPRIDVTSKIRELLSKHGPLTIGQLASRIGVVRNTVARHLAKMDDIRELPPVPGQRNRPAARYALGGE